MIISSCFIKITNLCYSFHFTFYKRILPFVDSLVCISIFQRNLILRYLFKSWIYRTHMLEGSYYSWFMHEMIFSSSTCITKPNYVVFNFQKSLNAYYSKDKSSEYVSYRPSGSVHASLIKIRPIIIKLLSERVRTKTHYLWLELEKNLLLPSNWHYNWKFFILSWNTEIRLSFNQIYFKFLELRYKSILTWRQVSGYGYVYLKCLTVVFFIDALLTDDEPLWEPVEWSLIQYWLIFIFMFSWIAENLITSRYGSYTGRDKRVWFAWYKTFWLIEGYYVISLGAAVVFVIVPFYHEVNFITPFMMSWWDWYSRTFFLKFLALYTVILLLTNYLQITISQFHWKKSLFIIILVNIFLAYLVYTQFIITFFVYFTDPNWYSQTRLVDYVQLSHEPHKWSWGAAKRDHFSYHNSKTVFWFKNDGPFAGAMLFLNIFFFLTLFSLHIYWLALTRRVFATQELTFSYTTSCVAALRQFYYFFSFFFLLTFISLLTTYWRLPIEFYSVNATSSWFWLCIEFLINNLTF